MICFYIYSKRGINAISLIIAILIYLNISVVFPKTNNNVKIKARLIKSQGIYNIVENINNDWELEIPKINLEAEISEGTDMETLNRNIAHFSETVKENGNIGLAAHNRGYKVNYFQNIKNLEEGDKIFYTYKRKKTRIYC